MKKALLFLLMIFLFATALLAQVIPAKIQKYLDENYTSQEYGAWKQAPGSCDGGKWILTGDFNGDGRSDYLVRFSTGKSARDKRLHLVGFINEKGDYTPDAFFEEEYSGDVSRSASSVVKRGTTVSLGLGSEGQGPFVDLQADSITQYVCETDAAITYAYRGGEFKNIQSGYVGSTGPIVKPTPKLPPAIVAQPTPTTKPVPTQTPVPTPNETMPNIEGKYTIIKADGTTDVSTGTVYYVKGELTFKISDGRAFSSATAFISHGLITTGWNRTATVSADGRTIFWSDKSKWVRQ